MRAPRLTKGKSHMLGTRRLWKSAWLATALAVPLLAGGIAQAKDSEAVQKLRAVVDSPGRSPENKARDRYRHPVETLTFFGIKPNMTVVELWPFGGWFTEILAPYLREHGKLYAAAMDPASTSKSDLKYNSDLHSLLDAHPELFDKVQLTVLSPNKMEIAPDGSADMVVTFRNIHNWAWAGIDKQVFAAAFRALKPGGILGVEEHRNNDANFAPTKPPQAYVGEQWAIGMIESVGFRFVADSDINRNPKDTKDYAKGVWTLPPYFADGDKDREKYTAIGESDRFLLKFVKPR
jgi:predicted methyltransferase